MALALALAGCATGLGFDSSPVGGTAESSAPPTELITDKLIAAEQLAADSAAQQDLSPLFVATPPPYTIGRGDILAIVVWDHPELAAGGMNSATALVDGGAPPNAAAPGFAVDHMGRIQFPLIGLLTMEGLTAEQAREQLTKKSLPATSPIPTSRCGSSPTAAGVCMSTARCVPPACRPSTTSP